MAHAPDISISARCRCAPTDGEPGRGGFSLAELTVALAIGAILTMLLFGALTVQVRLAHATATRTVESDALRTAAHVLSGEARRMSIRDVRAMSPESVAIRAFRGTAIVCSSSGTEAGVRYGGDRLPNPRKDSVIVITASGRETGLSLLDVRSATDGCAAASPDEVQLWVLSDTVTDPVVMLLFESGSFHISNRALRYRVGLEGRQPLTAEVFHGTSAFDPDAVVPSLGFQLVLGSGRAVRFAPPLGGYVP